MAETIILSDSRTLAYEEYGTEGGAPLVFHHGTPGSHVLGKLLSGAAYQQDVRLIVPSRPGFGGSDPHPDATPETWADDCLTLADALDLEEFAVAGFSGGGPYALAVAEAAPDRVTRAGIVSSPVPESDAPFETLTRVPRVFGITMRLVERVSKIRSPASVAEMLGGEDVSREAAEDISHDFHTALVSTSGMVRESQWIAGEWSLPDPDVETRVWHGSEDTNVDLGPVREAYEHRPEVEFTVVDADHVGTLLAVTEDLVALAR